MPTDLFWPVMALVGWTFAVLLLIPFQRFKAVFAGQVSAADFVCGESSTVPPTVSIPNRVFMNLLEVPVLFYVVCTIAFVTHSVNSTAIMLAWTYFGLRVLHSLIYLSYNNILHRFLAFAASNVVLLIMWLLLLQALAR